LNQDRTKKGELTRESLGPPGWPMKKSAVKKVLGRGLKREKNNRFLVLEKESFWGDKFKSAVIGAPIFFEGQLVAGKKKVKGEMHFQRIVTLDVDLRGFSKRKNMFDGTNLPFMIRGSKKMKKKKKGGCVGARLTLRRTYGIEGSCKVKENHKNVNPGKRGGKKKDKIERAATGAVFAGGL